MTEQEAIEELRPCVDFPFGNDISGEAAETAICALEEVQRYRAWEERLKKVYGDCPGLLELTITHLEHHVGIDIPEPVFKARLLTDGVVDQWEAYKALGTPEQLREALGQLNAAKEDIRKLLCREYGSSCQFCIHDENEAAMCCNIGGSGRDWNHLT